MRCRAGHRLRPAFLKALPASARRSVMAEASHGGGLDRMDSHASHAQCHVQMLDMNCTRSLGDQPGRNSGIPHWLATVTACCRRHELEGLSHHHRHQQGQAVTSRALF